MRWTNAYPRSGHSHGPLDGCFGQLCVKLANAEFDDDMDVVRILNEQIRTMNGLDEGSREGAQSYKFDHVAQWVPWLEETNVQMYAKYREHIQLRKISQVSSASQCETLV